MNPKTSRAAQVRIIGGQWKRTPLAVPDVAGLRPTPDRVRETLFNWLGQTLTGKHCLDLFAGTGALGFEAASRGAAHVLCIEQAMPAVQQLRRNAQKLAAAQVDIRHGDARSVAESLVASGAQFDVIFLDPPFRQGWFDQIMPWAARLLAPGADLYWESDTPCDPATAAHYGLRLVKIGRAGQVHYHWLQNNR